MSAGTAVITAEIMVGTAKYDATCVVVVKAVPTIVLDKSTLALTAGGDTGTITATTTPNDYVVDWESSDTAVATVANGVVTPLTAGSTTITATITVDGQEYTATCAVTVAS